MPVSRGNAIPSRLRLDVRIAARSLRRTPVFTVAMIAVLGLGIGASTAMFTVYKTVLVDRLPILEQDRLVVMHPLDRGGVHLDGLYPHLVMAVALFQQHVGDAMGAAAVP